jgi:hypothetical protein
MQRNLRLWLYFRFTLYVMFICHFFAFEETGFDGCFPITTIVALDIYDMQ